MSAILTKLTLAFTVALMMAAAGTLFFNLDAEQRGNLTEYGLNNPLNATRAGAQVIIGYDISSPYWEIEWMGEPDTKTFLLEEIPYPDPRDLFILVPYWYISLLIVKLLWRRNTKGAAMQAILTAILLFTIGTLTIWALWHFIWYKLMLSGAAELGITDAIIQTRADVAQKVEQAALWLILLSVANGIILFRALWPNGGKQ